MVKTLISTGYSIEEINVSVDADNQIVAYKVRANITFINGEGREVNIRYTSDLWPVANTSQKTQAQAVQDLVRQYMDNQFL